MSKPIVSPDVDIAGEGLRALAVAVLLQAATDARAGDAGAAYWLETDGIVWAECLGLAEDPDPAAPSHFLDSKGADRRLYGLAPAFA